MDNLLLAFSDVQIRPKVDFAPIVLKKSAAQLIGVLQGIRRA